MERHWVAISAVRKVVSSVEHLVFAWVDWKAAVWAVRWVVQKAAYSVAELAESKVDKKVEKWVSDSAVNWAIALAVALVVPRAAVTVVQRVDQMDVWRAVLTAGHWVVWTVELMVGRRVGWSAVRWAALLADL